jgi:hypothetical protein
MNLKNTGKSVLRQLLAALIINGKEMKASDIRFTYIRDNEKPVTVAYIFDDEGKCIVYNAAECSTKDTFCKVTGKVLAVGRLQTNRVSHPNDSIPYALVSAEDGKPKYRLITREIRARLADAGPF